MNMAAARREPFMSNSVIHHKDPNSPLSTTPPKGRMSTADAAPPTVRVFRPESALDRRRRRRRTDLASRPPDGVGTVLRLCEQFLRAHRLLGYAYAVRAVNGARSAVAAANRPVLGGHPLEVFTAQPELAVAVRIHDEPHQVPCRQALGALAVTLAAHAAEIRTDFFRSEVFTAQPELAVAVRIHDEPHQVPCRQALGALAVTLAAHAAEIRTDFFESGRQHLGIRIRKRLSHDSEVLLQLVD